MNRISLTKTGLILGILFPAINLKAELPFQFFQDIDSSLGQGATGDLLPPAVPFYLKEGLVSSPGIILSEAGSVPVVPPHPKPPHPKPPHPKPPHPKPPHPKPPEPPNPPEPKNPVTPPVNYQKLPMSDLFLTLYTGYESRYMYRGYNTVQAFSDPKLTGKHSNGVVYGGVNAQWKGLSASATYLTGVDKVVPLYGATVFNNTRKDTYQEVLFDVNYTIRIVKDLDLSPGFSYWYFPDKRFWGNSDQVEPYVRLRYNSFAWFRPGVSYERYTTSGLVPLSLRTGASLFVFDVTGGKDDLYALASGIKVGFNYYANIVYDYKYNAGEPVDKNSGWSNTDVGIRIPITINKLKISPAVNYSWGLSSHRAWSPGFWTGVRVSYTF